MLFLDTLYPHLILPTCVRYVLQRPSLGRNSRRCSFLQVASGHPKQQLPALRLLFVFFRHAVVSVESSPYASKIYFFHFLCFHHSGRSDLGLLCLCPSDRNPRHRQKRFHDTPGLLYETDEIEGTRLTCFQMKGLQQ